MRQSAFPTVGLRNIELRAEVPLQKSALCPARNPPAWVERKKHNVLLHRRVQNFLQFFTSRNPSGCALGCVVCGRPEQQ